MSLRPLCLLIVCWGPHPAAVAQQTPPGANIQPPDVLVRVERVRDELELIRHVMGRPTNRQPNINVRNAAPREVYFQALTMFRKAERLCFEHTREHTAAPELPERDIGPADVLELVNATLACLDRVKARLGIEQESQTGERADDGTPTDVFRSIVQANRQLNLLLERSFAPSDVFEQVTLGIGYASRLLEAFPDATTMPEAPEFQIGKQPGDVYRRLLVCFQRIRRIANMSGLNILELEGADSQIAHAEPSDVYDIASLLVSELAFLHSQLDAAAAPRDVYYVGRKFPSHVYQRAGILERQLIQLEERATENPDWLREPVEQP